MFFTIRFLLFYLPCIGFSSCNLIDISTVQKCLVDKFSVYLSPRQYPCVYKLCISFIFYCSGKSYYPLLFFYKSLLLAYRSDKILLIHCYLIIFIHPRVHYYKCRPFRSLAYTLCNTKVKVDLFTFCGMKAVHKGLFYIFDSYD